MGKLVITTEEVAQVPDPPPGGQTEAKLRAPIRWWLRLGLSPLLLVLPLLGIFSGVVWLIMRNKEPRIKYAWIHYLFGLLVASSFVTTGATTGYWFYAMRNHETVAAAQPQSFELDKLAKFPQFGEKSDLSTEELVRKMQPVVLIVSRIVPGLEPTRGNLASGGFGAGVLLRATEKDYLIATARHVVIDKSSIGPIPHDASMIVWGKEGGYARADVVGIHKLLDLVLLRVKHAYTGAMFAQPVCPFEQIKVGGRIVALGHPQGMFYTVSDGLVSRTDGDAMLQISAPISPGASGGPVYDLRGQLLGIITSVFDKTAHPQAENLNFAVRADALLKPENWEFADGGSDLVAKFAAAASDHSPHPPTTTTEEAKPADSSTNPDTKPKTNTNP